MNSLTREEIELMISTAVRGSMVNDVHPLIESAIEKAIHRHSTSMGISHHDPFEMQQDLHFLRRIRQEAEQRNTRIWTIVLAGVFTVVFTLLTLGAEQYIRQIK